MNNFEICYTQEIKELIMRNKNINYNARMLINELLIEPEIAFYMRQLKDKRYEVFLHSLNVAYLTAEIFYSNRDLFEKYDEEYLKSTVTGALLHDIGKLKISNSILLKKGKLTQAERKRIEKHPEMGYKMIKDNPYFSERTKNIVLYHHEKVDGSGYPYGKEGKDLSFSVQIVTICDIYDALTEDRTYREKASIRKAFDVIINTSVATDKFIFLAACSDL